MIQTTTSCKTPTTLTHSFSQAVPTKLPKNIDKRDLMTSGKFTEKEEMTHIYRISLENMTGRRDLDSTGLGSTVSLRNSSSDELASDGNSDGSTNRLDFIHPDEEMPVLQRSFQEEHSLNKEGRDVHLGHSNSFQISSSPDKNRYSNGSHPRRYPVEIRSGHPLPDSVRASAPNLTVSTTSNQSEKNISQSRLRRARKVITSRKSLDSGSKWLSPFFISPDGRGSSVSVTVDNDMDDMPEILGLLENVVYPSPATDTEDIS